MTPGDHLKGRQVLITGAGGFVGANFAHALSRIEARTHCVVRSSTDLWRLEGRSPTIEIHHADLGEAAEVRSVVDRIEPEYVYHFASVRGHPRTEEERRDAIRSTVSGTMNILEALDRHDVRGFVHIGSSLVYGQSDAPHRESDCIAPVDFRGTVKGAATLVWRNLVRVHEIPSVELRLYCVYGPFEHPGRLIPNAILAAHHDREIPITPPGYTHDRVFIDDVTEACLLATKPNALTGEVINIASGAASTNEEVVALIEKITGRKIRTREGGFPPRPFDRAQWVANIDRARARLGWEPRHDLEAGLRKTIDWLRENEAHYS